MSNLNLRRVSVDLEITANKVKGVSAALSYLHESAYFFKIISGATSAIG